MWRRHLFFALSVVSASTPGCAQVATDLSQPDEALLERIASSDEEAARAAADAAALGEFGFLVEPLHRVAGVRVPGVVCFTPFRRTPPLVRAVILRTALGDMLRTELRARAYNVAVAEHPDFPYPDLCRAVRDDDDLSGRPDELLKIEARAMQRAPDTLHEAARWGDRGDVSRLLDTSDLDAADAFGMSPLAWAVARGNEHAIDALVEAGADPLGEGVGRRGPLYWSVSLARREAFERLAVLAKDRHEDWMPRGWPRLYVTAAIQAGDPEILEHILSEPHEPVAEIPVYLPGPESVDVLLQAHPNLAGPLLLDAVSAGDRLDLVQLALEHGADPDFAGRYGATALTEAAKAFLASSEAMVDLLLAAGADVNRRGERDYPVWRAVGTLTLDGERTETDEVAWRIFHRLVAAGADMNPLDELGKPPIWFLLFPGSRHESQMDASFVTPALLRELAAAGMNVNAEWEGRRVLGYVESNTPADSELVAVLRELGALP